MEMKVVNVDFVENEMVELDVVQIGSNGGGMWRGEWLWEWGMWKGGWRWSC
ncbi:MAG TPA: hypothetical protein PLP73_04715 [Candidatus Absconditabacterales bacterium]|nr:hypothetical protein [Candidatus Absconditabacterales bacterium]